MDFNSQKKRNLFRFLEKSYDENLNLLVFARDYFNGNSDKEKSLLSQEDKLIYTLAMSTITTQLTSTLSWLMVCRAVQSGELELEDVKNEDFRMPEFDFGFDDSSSKYSRLNDTMKELLKRSSSLYNRIKRMENSIRADLDGKTPNVPSILTEATISPLPIE